MTYEVQLPTDDTPLQMEEAVVTTSPARTVPVLIPAARYTSPEWFERELRDMWPNTWQLACTLDHVSEPGDYYEHKVGKLSILVVRGDDGELRAFQNVCRHRGAELCTGAGGGLQELRCPFHRWTWGLDGRLREVPSRREFGVRNDDYPLFEASVGTWGPLVFVNGDPAAAGTEPLAGWLHPVPQETAWSRIDEWRCTAVVSMRQECNWKTLIEAFSETYHVQGIHREMLGMADDVHGPEVLWEHHGRLVQSYGVQSPRVGRTLDDAEVYRAFVEVMGERMGVKDLDAPVPPIHDGGTLRDAIAAQIVEHNRAQGVELGDFTTSQLLDLEQYNLFPNITVLFFGDMLSIVRSRPGAHVEEAFMDGFFFRREQNLDAPRTKPYAVDLDTGAEPPFGMVLNQDVRNFLPSQRGLHQPGFEHLTVSPTAECRIVNLHRNLERALGITPTEMLGLAENGLELA
ncbi:MAG: aromatic ring-hydroxylating dioxygenase subunit alpha [Acidimicrobiia bacterium]